MARYHQMTLQLIDALLPGYGEALHHPQTSLRLHPITAWRNGPAQRRFALACGRIPVAPGQGDRICASLQYSSPREPRTWRTDFYPRGTLPRLKPWSLMPGCRAGDHQKSA
jgi:hypothetical protein